MKQSDDCDRLLTDLLQTINGLDAFTAEIVFQAVVDIQAVIDQSAFVRAMKACACRRLKKI